MEGVSSALSADALKPVMTALTSSITPADIISIIAIMIGVGMGFVLMWFGIRKLISIFRNAVTKGKISV